MTFGVVLSPRAEVDLEELYDYIAERTDAARAAGYIERITARCAKLQLMPECGTRRDDLRSGLRTLGFERRATIAFHIEPGRVVIDRVLYAGRQFTDFSEA